MSAVAEQIAMVRVMASRLIESCDAAASDLAAPVVKNSTAARDRVVASVVLSGDILATQIEALALTATNPKTYIRRTK